MFTDQQLALENLRFLAKAGGAPQFYDLLRSRLLDLAESWEGMTFTGEELDVLEANRRRLVWELDHYRRYAAQHLG